MIDLRPSGSSIWTRCSANPVISQGVEPQPDSDAAREGTCAAWVAEQVLNGDAGSVWDMEGETHANGWVVTPDMLFHVGKYVDLIQSFGGEVVAENFVRLTDFIAGTLDAKVSVGPVLRVIDLKYGMEIIEPFELPQLMIYGAATMYDMDPVPREIELSIFQPRAWHPNGIYRTWKLGSQELHDYAEWIVERGKLCQVPEPVATPGDHCRYCPGASRCAANAWTLAKAHAVVQETHHRDMSDEEIASELAFLDQMGNVLKGRRNAIAAMADVKLRDGKFIRGYRLAPRKGNRVFSAPPAVVHALTGYDPHDADATVTPAELERRGANPEVVNSLTRRPDIAPKLERLSANDLRNAFRK